MLVEKTVTQFVEVTASDEPAPGGGSIAALSGAMGAALLNMVCGLSIGRAKFADVEAELKPLNENLQSLRVELLKLIDDDTESFNKVMDAFKMPKETEEEKGARSIAIQEATKGAARIPLRVAEACVEVLRTAPVIAAKGNKNAITDAGVAAKAAETGVVGAVYNVLINLGSLKDENFVTEYKVKTDAYLKEGKELLAQVQQIVESNI